MAPGRTDLQRSGGLELGRNAGLVFTLALGEH